MPLKDNFLTTSVSEVEAQLFFFKCSGSLVSIKGQQVILSTAECVDVGTPTNYSVTAG